MKQKKFNQDYFKNRSWTTTPSSVIQAVISELKIISREKLGKDLSELRILDVGSGEGEYSFALSKIAKKVVGVEPYIDAYKKAESIKRKSKSKVTFINSPIEKVTIKEKFDLALSLTTLEHMPNANASYKKIFELLEDDGIIYLTAPNKLWPYEHHYRLYFLSWLPLRIANLYMKLMKRGASYQDSSYSLSYFGTKKLFNSYGYKYTFSLPHDLNSTYIGCGASTFGYGLVKKVGINLIKWLPFMWVFSKGFIVILQKRKKEDNPFFLNTLYHYFLTYESIPKANSKILDYGCGDGFFLSKISTRFKKYGYDVDKLKIDNAKKKYKDINFSYGKTSSALPYKTGFFDYVSIFHVLEHVDTEKRVLEEISRVLKKDGILVVSSPYKGLFAWADSANLRYQSPFLHKILATIYYGKDKYSELFLNNPNKLYGDSTSNRDWHKHYSETEIRQMLKDYKIIEFRRFSLIQPFLLDLYNLWVFLFKKHNKIIDRLIWYDNKLMAGSWSYSFWLVAQKK